MRNGVENPAEFAGANVEGADIAGRRRERFGIAAAHDKKIFVNDSRAGEDHELRGSRFAAEPFAQIDAAVLSEGSDGFPGRDVDGIDKIHDADEDAFVPAVAPVRQAAIGLRPANAGIKFPEKFSGGSVQGKDFLHGGDAVQNSVDDDGAGLQTTFFSGIEAPRELEILDVFPVDLRERRIVRISRRAAVNGPVALLLSERIMRYE